jgi:hypothetical protein
MIDDDDDDNEFGKICGMRIGRGTEVLLETCPSVIFFTTNPT